MIDKTFNDSSARQDTPAVPAKTLAKRIEEAHAFFDPQNLANLLIKYEGEVGLLVIDVQEKFCDPDHHLMFGSEETVHVSERIKDLAPEFRKAGIPIYAIYFDDPQKDASTIDFYKFSPEPEDILVAKDRMSAFAGGNIKEILDNDHRKLLLACGVYLGQCVRETVEDAVDQGFDVCLLRDLTGDSDLDTDHTDQNLAGMQEKGIAILPSEHVLEALQIAKSAEHAPKRKATAPFSRQ